VPLIDERTGLVTREWFRFFNNIYVITGGSAEGVIPISSGGTGATSASQARANLQAGTVNRVLGEGSVNGIFLTGNVTTEGSIRLNGTLRLDTFIIGAAAVSNGGTGVQCTGITTQTADFNVSNATSTSSTTRPARPAWSRCLRQRTGPVGRCTSRTPRPKRLTLSPVTSCQSQGARRVLES
jgi:hypothetical protein